MRDGAGVVRVTQASRGQHAECAYLLDRALKTPGSTEDFARAALDAVRLALRPAYAAIACRSGTNSFHCGDNALFADMDQLAELLTRTSRALLAQPSSVTRDQTRRLGLASLDRAMAASAFEVVFPVCDNGQLLGVLALGSRPDRTAYSIDDIEFCDRVGARLTSVAAREALATEATSLRAATAESERLASVGRMAAGLAHEIRNPLVSIRTFTQLLPERHADEEFRSGFLDLTLSEIDRISTLVGEILSYARPAMAGGEEDENPATDVADSVERTCLLLRSHARSAGVSLDFDAAELSSRGAIDEDKLRQVVINLVVNGIQACDGRGRVRVNVGNADSGNILVEVADDGPGMSAAVAAQVFEPFFTTRREGTGLGLALVKRMIDEASATISVATTPGSGTTFRIELLTEAAAFARTAEMAEAQAAKTGAGVSNGHTPAPVSQQVENQTPVPATTKSMDSKARKRPATRRRRARAETPQELQEPAL